MPSKRLETYNSPSRPNTNAVAFIMSVTNGLMLKFRSILKTATGTFCPREPLNVV